MVFRWRYRLQHSQHHASVIAHSREVALEDLVYLVRSALDSEGVQVKSAVKTVNETNLGGKTEKRPKEKAESGQLRIMAGQDNTTRTLRAEGAFCHTRHGHW